MKELPEEAAMISPMPPWQAAADRRRLAPAVLLRLRLLDPDGRPVPGDWPSQARRAFKGRARSLPLRASGIPPGLRRLNTAAIERLRRQKRRPAKPLAVMARDLHCVRRWFELSAPEEEVLRGATSPIILLQFGIPVLGAAGALAAPRPAQRRRYAPPTLLSTRACLIKNWNSVMTSGNLSGQPLVYRDEEGPAQAETHDRLPARP